MRLIDADLALGEIPNEIKDYAYWIKAQPTVTELNKSINTRLTTIKIGEFKQDNAGNIFFDRENGRLNEAHTLLAFSDKVFKEVKGKKVRVTISIEEAN